MWFIVVIFGVVAGLMDDDWPPTEAAILLAFVAFSLFRRYRTCRISVATGVGILAYLYANVYLAVIFDNSLPETLHGQTLLTRGEVVDVLQQSESQQQIRFRVDHCLIASPSQGDKIASVESDLAVGCGFTGEVILNRYFSSPSQKSTSAQTLTRKNSTLVHAKSGEEWQFSVRLYPIRGFVNRGQSRYRLLQLAKGVMARGYVRGDEKSVRLEQANAWRRWQNTWVSVFEEEAHALGLPLASTLLTGQSDSLSPEHWRLLQQTGTVHLVVVSGLHLGVLLGAGWLLLSFISRLLPVDRYWQRLFLLFTPVFLLLPMLLIWPSGVAVSRALLMVLLFILMRAKGIMVSPFRILIVAVTFLLIVQPIYLLRPGFYYSVWAVALLLMLVSGDRHLGLFIRIQLVLMAGLLPLQHFWLNTPDLISGLVNLVAIPLVSLLILPVALFMALSPFTWLESLFAFLLGGLEHIFWQLLDVGLVYGFGVPEFSVWFYGLLLLFALIWALPSLPGRAVVSMALLVAIADQGSNKAAMEEEIFEIEVLDVGQGLAVAVNINGQLLVYDSGPVFRSGFAPVSMLLPPRLASEDRDIDLLVISHDDKDHAGGLGDLLPLSAKVLAGQPERIFDEGLPISACFQGQKWRWGEVLTEVLYPPQKMMRVQSISDNERSCVLRIQSSKQPMQSILLTGDIDVKAEQWLLSSGQDLTARWLVASHHGSAGGNSLAFLSAVSPEGVIYSAGYRNSYGHPARKVQHRLAYLRSVLPDSKRNINFGGFPLFYREYNTADLGGIRLKDLTGDGRWELLSQREQIPERWLWRKLR
ncbi:DNA internalization-related competence protein ComEC/Rec2 [Oceanospirillum sanctuarii]|uniref:DNA internalization-related competence protein ComEC/Rec2 n=1 Tax=Oceanospirillum sanctuarii TaxID=1434821 RepID=UPI000A387B07|nr:DNA internalization-related competence protein ComEC/Rec2 [Oceanospirillum sanctuarii]